MSAAVSRAHPAFRKNAQPFYDAIRVGLGDLVDGEHFWDTVAEDAVFEFLYTIPGFTDKIVGRQAYMDWFGHYPTALTGYSNLHSYYDSARGVATLEYQMDGTSVTGKPYHNRFCSIVFIKDRKISHWKDYMDGVHCLEAMQ